MSSSGQGSSRIPEWMGQALELAEEAARADEVPVGAVVVHDGRVVGRGRNRREEDQSPIAHAEILAIQEAAKALGTWRLTGCILVVTLEPCPMCLAACQQGRIDAVHYGARDPKGGALSLGYGLHQDRRTHHRFVVEHHETAAAGKVLSDFFSRKRGKSG